MNPCPKCLGMRPAQAAAVLWLVAAGMAAAQTDDAEAEAGDEPQPVDEIVVTAEKPGDRKRVDTPYEELMRERLLEEMDRMQREEEEIAWRRSPTVEQPSRISFGYRPQDRARDSRDTSLTDLPLEKTKPATIFRFEF
jgi:hypothetical protein